MVQRMVGAGIDYLHNYSYDIWESWSTTIFFPDKCGVGSVSLLGNSMSPDDPIMKACEYEVVVYLMKIVDAKYLFFKPN